jgi:LacI family transcriptional regulator
MTTMRQVAEQVGVSLKTVSRVFNGDPHVSPEVRERVQRALAQSEYVPNELAQTFRSGRGRVIGVVVPDLLDPFFAAVVSAVDAEAKRHGYATIVTATGFDPDLERECVSSMLARNLAGLVLAPASTDQSFLDGIAAPVVVVDQPAIGASVDSFVHEDALGAALATRHLLQHGVRRIGFLGRAPQLPTSQERLAGYRHALQEAGEPLVDALVVADVESPADAEAGYARLRAHGAEGVLTADPRTTIACIRALQVDPMALVGFGDFPLADRLDPAITVIDQDPAAMGALSAAHLFERILDPSAGPVAGGVVRLPVRLVERASCGLQPR